MTVPALQPVLSGLTPDPDPAAEPAPRPGSRAARLAHPLTLHAIKQLAADYDVCIRPLAMRRTDIATGETTVIDLPCGSTREAKCPGCAKRAKRLRQQQCREGWHRTDEVRDPKANPEQVALLTLRAEYEFARANCLARADWGPGQGSRRRDRGGGTAHPRLRAAWSGRTAGAETDRSRR